MPEYDEADASYIRGRIDGYLQGVAAHSGQNVQFDQDHWESLYESRVIYSSIPLWASREERRRNAPGVVLCDWIDETETKLLKKGTELLPDRSGSMVFPDGSAIFLQSGDPVMLSLTEREVRLMERWSELQLEMIREAYGYEP